MEATVLLQFLQQINVNKKLVEPNMHGSELLLVRLVVTMEIKQSDVVTLYSLDTTHIPC